MRVVLCHCTGLAVYRAITRQFRRIWMIFYNVFTSYLNNIVDVLTRTHRCVKQFLDMTLALPSVYGTKQLQSGKSRNQVETRRGNKAWKRGVETRRGQIWTQTPTSRDLNPMCSNDLSEVRAKFNNIYKTLPRALYSHGRAPKSMRQIPFCWVQRKPWFWVDFGLCTRSTTRRGGYRWK